MPYGSGTRADGLPCGNSGCRPTSEMPSRYFARRKPTGSLGKSWTWMEAPRSWMRTSRWKSSNCPPQEAPTPPSPFFAEVRHSKSSNGMSPSLGRSMVVVTDDSRDFPCAVFVLPQMNESPFPNWHCILVPRVVEAVNPHLNRAIALHVMDLQCPWNEFSSHFAADILLYAFGQ